MKKTVCELFAGVGGFRLGLEKSSKEWNTVWMNQWEPSRKSQWAFECYRKNFANGSAINEWSNTDISKVDTKNIPNHTLLVGGFPCQDYSVAKTKAEGIKGKKGVLWWELERILKDKQPKFILLENVNRLIKSKKGRDFGTILSCLNNLNYIVEWRVVNAAEYGFPQKRKRVFIFATKKGTKYHGQLSESNVEKLIYDFGFFAQTFPVENLTNNKIISTFLPKNLIEVSNNFSFDFKKSGLMKNGKIYTVKTNAIKNQNKTMVLGDILENREMPDKYFLSKEEIPDWEYLKGAKEEPRTAKNGHKYIYREGAVPFPDSLNKPGRTILTSERTKNRSTHVVKDKQTGRLRKLTPVECERLNCFPDDWTETANISHSFRYFCMGNALVVGLVEKMGKKIIEIINEED